MHEVSIANSIYRILREKMETGYGEILPVRKIRLIVGKMSNVVPRCLDFAMEMVSKGTVFENAEVEIEYVPLKIRCLDCGVGMTLDEPFLFCDKCGSFNVEVLTGKELLVDSFEVDENDIATTGNHKPHLQSADIA